MRICFSIKPKKNRPMGGGAKFAINLAHYLTEKGCQIEYKFNRFNPPDLIIMFDPRKLKYSNNWLSLKDIQKIQDGYKLNIPIIHRINDIGYPKTRPITYLGHCVELANRSNHLIFVSNFLKKYYGSTMYQPSSVIYNSIDENLYSIKPYHFDKPRLVTHHWSNNILKGWDFYKEIDDFLPSLGDISFTIIGNPPQNMSFKHAVVRRPLHGVSLANEIKKNNIYITASRHEPCGNHYLEGIGSGLPLLFHLDGGGITEVGQFGLGFHDFDSFKKQLQLLTQNHRYYYDKICNEFNYYTDIQFEKYYKIIKEIVEKHSFSNQSLITSKRFSFFTKSFKFRGF